VTFITLSFKDAPDNRIECKLILDRLAEAIPDVTTMHLVDGARAGLMKDVVAWLGRFQHLKVLGINPECFHSGNDIDHLDLAALASLPHIQRLISTSYFLCAYLASCRRVNGGTLPRSLEEVIIIQMWTPPTQSAASALTQDVERLHNAITEASRYPDSEARYPQITLRIKLYFDRFRHRAEELCRIWNRLHPETGIVHHAKAKEKPSLETLPCFRPTESRDSLPQLSLELNLPSTVNEIQRGMVDEEVMAFCRMFPTLRKIMLCSPSPVNTAGNIRSTLHLRKERLDKFKSVCPELHYGRVY
jgi:hypothetical protein